MLITPFVGVSMLPRMLTLPADWMVMAVLALFQKMPPPVTLTLPPLTERFPLRLRSR